MIIAQVIGDLRIGGAERLFVDLVNSLNPQNTFVVLLSDTRVEPSLRQSLNPAVHIHVCPVHKRTFYVDLPKLAYFFRSKRVDVVHTHMFWANLYGSVAAALAGVPVIVTSEHGRNEWKKQWHKWAEAKIVSRIANRRLCVSQDILERRRDVDGVPQSKLEVLPNGTTVPEEYGEHKAGEIVVGSVGRLVAEKDYPTLVAAISRLIKAGHDCRLELVGEGPARADIEKAIDAEGLQDRAVLVGARQDVSSYLRRWSVFASSSVQEGQPIALLEAMAHGLPCVATAVGGVPDTLDDGREGIIVPPSNAEALSDALARLIENRELRCSLGDAARQRVVRDFSIESIATRCMELYRTAFGTKAS